MNYYDYTPSLAAAVIFCILFGSITGYHFWLLFRNRTWFFIVFGIGGLCLFLLSKISSRAYTDFFQHSSRNCRLWGSSNKRKSKSWLHASAIPCPKSLDFACAFAFRRINLYASRSRNPCNWRRLPITHSRSISNNNFCLWRRHIFSCPSWR